MITSFGPLPPPTWDNGLMKSNGLKKKERMNKEAVENRAARRGK